MIVTSTLAKGAVLLSRRKVIVKRLDAIQNFGAMDILCTDKTGTLTQDKIALARHADAYRQDTDEVLHFAFLDPPKESAAPALKKLAKHGITVKVLTGDNDLVTAQVCRQAGLPLLAGGSVLLGAQVEALSDFALKAAAEQHHSFAKLSPLHKERIARALRASGHVVGFMGDGINDAPALRAADIGISVDSAVDIAKEAADIILLEKSLLVLDEGVVEGRTTFCNMLKYIRMTASSNFGNVLSVLVASAFLPLLPMLPLQLLVQNLL